MSCDTLQLFEIADQVATNCKPPPVRCISILTTLISDLIGTCSTPESTTHPSGSNLTHIALSHSPLIVIGVWRHKFAFKSLYLVCMGLSSEQQAPWKLPTHQKQQQQEARRGQPFSRQSFALGLFWGGCVASSSKSLACVQ
jgi:hypothetical protein